MATSVIVEITSTTSTASTIAIVEARLAFKVIAKARRPVRLLSHITLYSVDLISGHNFATLSMFDRDFPVIVERRGLIHGIDRVVSLQSRSIEDVCEATRRFWLLVLDDIDFENGAKLGKYLAHLVFGRPKRYPSDIEVAVVLGINDIAIDIVNYLFSPTGIGSAARRLVHR